MIGIRKKRLLIIFLLFALIISGIIHLFSGQIKIEAQDYFKVFLFEDNNNDLVLIAREFRLPRMITAIIAGASLSAAGLLMQTLFSNPLAGPYVLGINTGSGLLVAATMMSGLSFFNSDFGVLFSALLGAFIFSFIILGLSMLVRSHIALLLIGLMVGSLAGSLVTALQATASAQQLKAFTMWTMGSLQQTRFDQLPILLIGFLVSSILSLFLIKPLNVLVLGERATELLGFNIKKMRVFIIVVTALFTGIVTAFCGPIAFVGLAVPNVTRILFRTTSHQYLLPGTMLIGGIFLLITDTIIQLAENYFILPLNAFTSLIGAPIIIYIILKRIV